MSSRNAVAETVTRLFVAYSKQGMEKDRAIMLIAASLGLSHAQASDIIDNAPGTGHR